MVPYHVVTGGNGGILVLPRAGLGEGYGNPVHYDRAFYFGEQPMRGSSPGVSWQEVRSALFAVLCAHCGTRFGAK